MKIGFLKLGKRVKLKEEHGIANGDFDSRQLLKLLSKHFPNDEFQIIGQHDLFDLRTSEYKEMFPNQNVVSHSNKMAHLDFTVCLSGPRILDEVYLPQIYILNEYGGKVIEVSHDIRFSLTNFIELKNQPVSSLGQGHYFKLNPHTQKMVVTQYAYQELLYLFEKEFSNVPEDFADNFESKIDLLVIATKVPENNFRETQLRDYILDSDLKAHFWGNLEMGLDFRGPYKYDELGTVCEMYKYSFLVPIIPEYATSKWVEMLYHNVIPILHPDYDSQRNTPLCKRFNGPRVNNKRELIQKIEMLNMAPNLAAGLLAEYKNSISNSEFYSGEFLAEIFRGEFQN